MCDCPHRFVLNAQLAPAIRYMHLKKVNCSKCSDPASLIICLGCLKNFCSQHCHNCSPLVYFPSYNVLFCKECKCQILSLDLFAEEQEQCFATLRAKFRSFRTYDFAGFTGVQELLAKPVHFDQSVQVYIQEQLSFVPYGQSQKQTYEREAKKSKLVDLEAYVGELQVQKQHLIEQLASLQKEGFHTIADNQMPPKPNSSAREVDSAFYHFEPEPPGELPPPQIDDVPELLPQDPPPEDIPFAAPDEGIYQVGEAQQFDDHSPIDLPSEEPHIDSLPDEVPPDQESGLDLPPDADMLPDAPIE